MNAFLQGCLLQTTPLLLTSLGGAFCRTAGLVNVGLDAFILVGAMAAEVTGAATHSALLGTAAGALAGACGCVLMGSVITGLGANPIVTGLGFNLFSHALCRLLVKTAFGVSGLLLLASCPKLPAFSLPLLGSVDILTLLAWALVLVMTWFLDRTRLGLHLSAAGSAPAMARTVGISAPRMLLFSTVVAGALCGLAGADLSLGIVGAFSDDISSGRGYVALAAFYIGRNRPFPTALTCLFLTALEELATRAQVLNIPVSLAQAFPYISVLVLMILQTLRTRHRHGGTLS
ncbi:ABC transporter permease [Gluconobacter sp. P1D12_c]|uniref:ABC transporter permease n=1 Tax=Gluconobacter sp. P1D12_c TaxID=2762614 RepID=UPI001C05116C|nr:ABC transporter permease [Gluconobacter sp. P1D12_c]